MRSTTSCTYSAFLHIVRKEDIMANMINSIDEAVDCKYLVVKDRKNQAKCGTLVHIMSAKENSGGGYLVGYRVTNTGQDFTERFETLKEFCNWVKPDSFIARYYDCFDISEIAKYIKINQRTFVNFCLPIIIVGLIVFWILGAAIIKGGGGIVIAIVGSVISVACALFLYKHSKTQIKMDLYKKIGSSRWGVNFK